MTRNKHSRLGIAAFVLAALAVAGLVADYLPMSAWRASNPAPAGGGFGEEIYFIYAGAPLMIATFAAFALGLACLFQQTRKRLFGLLAVILSTLPSIAFLLLR